MTLLTISQNIARDAKTEVPTSIIDNTQEVAKQIFQAVRLATSFLLEEWDWQVLQSENDFNSVILTVNYDIPSDFNRLIPDTFFNSTNNREVFIAKNPKEWRLLNLTTGSQAKEYFRIRANQTAIYPTPTAVNAYVYEYISKNIILATDGTTTKASWTVDSDTARIDEDLVELEARWRFLRTRGKEYEQAQIDARQMFNSITGEDGGRGTIYPKTRRFYGEVAFPQEVTP